MERFRWCLPGLIVALAGCFQAASPVPAGTGDQQGCVRNCSHGPVGGKGDAGGSGASGASGSSGSAVSGSSGSSGASSSGGSSSGGSTGSGSSSGSSGAGSSSSGGSSSSDAGCSNLITSGTICPDVAICPPSASCTTGEAFVSQLVDVLDCTTIGGASIAAIGADGVPYAGAAATTQGNGALSLCLPSGRPFSIQITAAQYPQTYYAEMLNLDAGYISQLAALSAGSLGAFAFMFPGGLDSTKALVLVKMNGNACAKEYAGWSLAVELPDGGSMPDGGYQIAYLTASAFPDPTATAIESNGNAFVYNIDPSLSDFLVITATKPDAGACPVITSTAGFTGRVYVAGGALTLEPILLP